MFKFVYIPSKDIDALEEIERPTSGGLEDDELQVFAKHHLDTGFDGPARIESVSDHLKTVGMKLDELDCRYQQAIRDLGVSLDIVTLQLPTAKNDFIGVSIYCDANGIAKDFKPNTRATALARACGHSIIVYGDAFVGRFHDDESKPWLRLDFSLEEAQTNAPWVKQCAKDNEGKDLRKFTTAGAFSSGMKSVEDYPSPVPTPKTAAFGEEVIISDNLRWTQTKDDVEIKFIDLPSNLTPKTVKVVIKTSQLQVTLPDTAITDPSDTECKILSPAGGQLFGSVHPDECTWSLETNSEAKALVISLVKTDSLRWITLVR